MARGQILRGAARSLAGLLATFAGAAPAPFPAPPPPAAQPEVPSVPRVALVPAPAPGLGPQTLTPRNQTSAYNLAATVEALFGKVAGRLGPSNPRWSTFQGELTPETIGAAVEQANAGMPFTLQDMYRRAVENDGHLGGVAEQRNAGVVAKRDRIDPPENLSRDPCAISVANWLRAVRDQIDDFDDSRFALLWADGAGYSCAENIWGWRRVIWYTHDNRRISGVYLVPVKLDIVEPRAFRFDTATDEPLLWLSGDYIELPPAKFLFHRSFGFTSLTERRGYMRSCIWLHAMKGWTLRDMAEFLAAYGLPQLLGEYDSTKFSQEEAREVARLVMENLGQLMIPMVPKGGFDLRNDSPLPSGALVHRDAAIFFNGEISKRVTLGPLVMESGSGYGLGDVHAEGALDGKMLSAQKLCASVRRFTFAPCLQLNRYRLAADLSVPPDEILAVLPSYSCRIQREETPAARQEVFSRAMKDGCAVSEAQYRHDLHIDEPKDKDDTLRGEAVSIPSAGAVAGAVDASKGLSAPPQGGEAPSGPVQPLAVNTTSAGALPAAALPAPALPPPPPPRLPPTPTPTAPRKAPEKDADGAEEERDTSEEKKPLPLTGTDTAGIVTVNEARARLGLSELPDGDLTVTEYMLKNGAPAPVGMQRLSAPQADPADPGVSISLPVPQALAAELALPGGEPPEGMHVTLAYLGRLSELTPTLSLPDLRATLEVLASGKAHALQGFVGGVLRLPASETSGGRDVVCAGVDVVGLGELRQHLVEGLEATGAPVSHAHGFQPHITLRYLDPAASTPVQTLPRRPVRFDVFELKIGEERWAFPLEEQA